MTTEQQIKNLMDTMAKHNCSLLEAQIRLTRQYSDVTDAAATKIREFFETEGSLTRSSKVVA